jgi:hypothetical protein
VAGHSGFGGDQNHLTGLNVRQASLRKKRASIERRLSR